MAVDILGTLWFATTKAFFKVLEGRHAFCLPSDPDRLQQDLLAGAAPPLGGGGEV
jgi:hypothetical protein